MNSTGELFLMRKALRAVAVKFLVFFAFLGAVFPELVWSGKAPGHCVLSSPENPTEFRISQKMGKFPLDEFQNLNLGLNDLETFQLLELLSSYQVEKLTVKVNKGPCLKVLSLWVELEKGRVLVVRPHYSNAGTAFSIQEKSLVVEESLYAFQGEVDEDIWKSFAEEKLSFEKLKELSEIFAWQIDFNQEIKKGTRWKILLQKKTLGKEFYSWGDIIAAEVILERGRSFEAYRFKNEKGEVAYYDQKGDPVKRTFLKAPIKFARISSRFKRKRFHPILKRFRPHLGVDYAAKVGTPVRSVGDGVVVSVGKGGQAGRMIRIKHANSFETAYKHLKSFADGIEEGAVVRQGEMIAFVGMTGLSTGPHLHFEFYQKGRYVNPLSKRLYPPLNAVPVKDLGKFLLYVTELRKQMPIWPRLVALSPSSSESSAK